MTSRALSLRGRHFGVLLVLALAGAAGCASSASGPPPNDALDTVEAAQLFHFGNQLAASGDSIRAEQYLAAAMTRGYPEAEVIPRLMEVCVQASRLSAALSYAEPYLDRHEDEWPLRMLVATLQMSLQQASTAHTNLERVIEQVPDEPEPHYLMGVLLRDWGPEVAASAEGTSNAHFTRYIELAPDGRHVREARMSIEGRYVRPEGEPARTERSVIETTDAPAPPSGPTRIAPGAPIPDDTTAAP